MSFLKRRLRTLGTLNGRTTHAGFSWHSVFSTSRTWSAATPRMTKSTGNAWRSMLVACNIPAPGIPTEFREKRARAYIRSRRAWLDLDMQRRCSCKIGAGIYCACYRRPRESRCFYSLRWRRLERLQVRSRRCFPVFSGLVQINDRDKGPRQAAAGE